MSAPTTTTEYQVWYDSADGARRSANAEDAEGVQQIISDLGDDEQRRQLLASTVGLTVPTHDYNFQILQVTTTTTPVDLP